MNVMARTFRGAKAIAEGMYTTLKHVRRPQVTINYPEQRPELAPAFRGLPSLPPDHEGKHTCIGCNLCARVCPPQCITISSQKGEDRKIQVTDFVVDANLCIMCGLCEEVCPVNNTLDKSDHPGSAIQLSHLYEMSSYTHEGLMFHLPQLVEIGRQFGRSVSPDLAGKAGTVHYAAASDWKDAK